MTIKTPYWRPDAVPSREGWRHPETNELLVAYHGLDELVPSVPVLTEDEGDDVIDESGPAAQIIKDVEEQATLTEAKPKRTRKKKDGA